ncbi:LysM peptidoglycan-binding domain-containing protein [Acinetobacter shaoyimingii]|uniref:LysM peptidoglycan-binding domain-containing protein n=1 Tax=Acinetobacter shaoyimingii TaxID=2715164 RepID=A0A6G8RZN4_9GAMM|nr:LysM peptidoglycan-binding domain-containing protein [Acinetobacter shaoyimingii]QIO07193.1 LysM peptidoglycan-binding domain-containing protein [Acinetobacter shaoyimingii]
MKKVLDSMPNLGASGFKKQCLALTICLFTGIFTVQYTQAASPNYTPPSIKANAPNVYVVKKGDTLWDISRKFLKSPWRWKEIWTSNRHVKNPHWIYPGDRLLLCTLNGKPLIGKDEGDGCAGVIRRHSGDMKLYPQIRVENLGNAIPVIPLDHIQQWLYRNLIVTPSEMPNAPYIVGTEDKRVIAGVGQTVYARGEGLEVGQRYGVYRQLEPYTTAALKGKKEVVALELTEVAQGTVVGVERDITTIELNQSFNYEVRRGDSVLPIYEADLPSLFYPIATNEVQSGGQVLRVMGSIGTGAQHSVVSIDRGTNHGAKLGHVLSIYQQGESIGDPRTKETIKLPNQRIGNLMIFKTFPNFSYAYILDSSLPVKVGSEVKAPPTVDLE